MDDEKSPFLILVAVERRNSNENNKVSADMTERFEIVQVQDYIVSMQKNIAANTI